MCRLLATFSCENIRHRLRLRGTQREAERLDSANGTEFVLRIVGRNADRRGRTCDRRTSYSSGSSHGFPWRCYQDGKINYATAEDSLAFRTPGRCAGVVRPAVRATALGAYSRKGIGVKSGQPRESTLVGSDARYGIIYSGGCTVAQRSIQSATGSYNYGHILWPFRASRGRPRNYSWYTLVVTIGSIVFTIAGTVFTMIRT